MALSNQKDKPLSKLVCLVRSLPVQDTPEERVRQQLLSHLLGPFGCRRSLLGVEVSLKSLISGIRPMPRRRLDIVCFSVHHGVLFPLLVIECKAEQPSPGAISQLNGYNFFLKAPYLALAWKEEILISHRGQIFYAGTFNNMPTYAQLNAELGNECESGLKK